MLKALWYVSRFARCRGPWSLGDVGLSYLLLSFRHNYHLSTLVRIPVWHLPYLNVFFRNAHIYLQLFIFLILHFLDRSYWTLVRIRVRQGGQFFVILMTRIVLFAPSPFLCNFNDVEFSASVFFCARSVDIWTAGLGPARSLAESPQLEMYVPNVATYPTSAAF